jgi:hypothetical protein
MGLKSNYENLEKKYELEIVATPKLGVKNQPN